MLFHRTSLAGRPLAGILGFTLALAAAGCAPNDDRNGQAIRPSDDGGGAADTGPSVMSPPVGGTCPSGGCAIGSTSCVLDTYIGTNNYIQIDRQMGNLSGDANLFTTGANNSNLPAANSMISSMPTYIDWDNTLITSSTNIEDHVLRDAADRDPTWLSDNDGSCISTATSTPDKGDLTMAAAASNDEFVYLHVQRQDNTGNAAYYWLFTAAAPTIVDPPGNCTRRITYDISIGDVLILSQFQPSADPTQSQFLVICTAVSTGTGLSTAATLNYTDAGNVWNCNSSPTNAIAIINTSNASPVSQLGTCTLNDLTAGGLMEPGLIAEVAVPISTFGGSGTCGRSFYGAIISRSSAGGTDSTEIKDLIGPARFNFGGITTTPAVTQTCDRHLNLSATAVDTQNQSVTLTSCDWKIDGTALSNHSCSFTTTTAYSAASHTIAVTGHVGSSCASSEATTMFTVQNPLSATASLSSNCNSQLSYGVTVSGTMQALTYDWTFTPSDPTGFVDGGTGQMNLGATGGTTYTGSVLVTETTARTGFSEACHTTSSAMTTPRAPIQVTLTPGSVPMCGGNSDQVQYTAMVTGGVPPYTYDWTGTPTALAASCDISMPTASTSATCSFGGGGINDCLSESLHVQVDDSDSSCPAATSSNAYYNKNTTINTTMPMMMGP